jgi:hypothetical protein
MYWGDSTNAFDSLVAFIYGFELARSTGAVPRSSLIPADFHSFVWQRIGSGPMNGHGWTSAIRMVAKSPREAFELFFTLREEYETRRASD